MLNSAPRPGSVTNRVDPLGCALWMIASCALLAGLATIGRYVTIVGVPPLQVVFLRVFFAFVTLTPLLALKGTSVLRTDHWRLYGIRAVIGSIAMFAWFTALSLIPIGEVTAISFLAPLFATIGAAFFLGEVVRMRRWAATLVGLCGALVILRPGVAEFGLGGWLALVAALAMGASSLLIKRLADAEDANKIVFLSAAIMTPLTLAPALYVWTWPEPALWPYLIAMGPIATLGHIALTRAFAAADASFAMSFDFARLPFAVLFGYAVFAETLDVWSWIGAAIVFASSLFIAHREALLNRRLASSSVGPISPRV